MYPCPRPIELKRSAVRHCNILKMTSCKLHIFQCQVGCFKLILEKQLRTNNFHLLPEQFRLEILALSFYFCKQDPMLRNMAVESDSFCTDQQFLFLFSMIEFHKIVFLFSRPQNFLMPIYEPHAWRLPILANTFFPMG